LFFKIEESTVEVQLLKPVVITGQNLAIILDKASGGAGYGSFRRKNSFLPKAMVSTGSAAIAEN